MKSCDYGSWFPAVKGMHTDSRRLMFIFEGSQWRSKFFGGKSFIPNTPLVPFSFVYYVFKYLCQKWLSIDVFFVFFSLRTFECAEFAFHNYFIFTTGKKVKCKFLAKNFWAKPDKIRILKFLFVELQILWHNHIYISITTWLSLLLTIVSSCVLFLRLL